MVTILVAAILLAVAVPQFQSTINSNRLAGAANELLTSLQTARMEAMRFNHRTTVCLSRNPTSTTPTCAPANASDATGYITYVDINDNDLYNAGTDPSCCARARCRRTCRSCRAPASPLPTAAR